jgi:hypothetical protein
MADTQGRTGRGGRRRRSAANPRSGGAASAVRITPPETLGVMRPFAGADAGGRCALWRLSRAIASVRRAADANLQGRMEPAEIGKCWQWVSDRSQLPNFG